MKVALIGGGGLAREIIACFHEHISFEEVWDDALKEGDAIYSLPVKGSLQHIPNEYSLPFVIGVGNPAIRRKIFLLLKEKKCDLQTLLHPKAILYNSSRIQIGNGSIIMPGAYLTTDICIEENVLLHMGTGLHHDVKIKAHSVLMPGSRITCGFTTPESFFLDSLVAVTSKNKHHYTL